VGVLQLGLKLVITQRGGLLLYGVALPLWQGWTLSPFGTGRPVYEREQLHKLPIASFLGQSILDFSSAVGLPFSQVVCSAGVRVLAEARPPQNCANINLKL